MINEDPDTTYEADLNDMVKEREELDIISEMTTNIDTLARVRKVYGTLAKAAAVALDNDNQQVAATYMDAARKLLVALYPDMKTLIMSDEEYEASYLDI